MVRMVLFCTAEYGKLNLCASDPLATKVQVIRKVPTTKRISSLFGGQK